MTVCKELIVTQLARRGSGKGPHAPLRIITQVYEKSGDLVADFDPNGDFSLEDMIAFADFVGHGKGDITDWLKASKKDSLITW